MFMYESSETVLQVKKVLPVGSDAINSLQSIKQNLGCRELEISSQRETGEKILRCKEAENRFGTAITLVWLRSLGEKENESAVKINLE